MPELARAYFIRTADEAGGGSNAPEGSGVGEAPASVPAQAVAVQFNPMSLQYGLTINNPQQGQRPDATQYAGRAEATLDMDLVFDTTHEGSDVRRHTVPLRNLGLASDPSAGGAAAGADGSGTSAANLTPPKVAFVWGTFRFVGVVASFREALDFFSAEGVPLRSGVHLSLRGTQNSEVFTAPPQQAGLGSGLGDIGRSIDGMARNDAAGGRAAGAALGAASLRVGLSMGGAAGGGGIRLGASVSVGASADAGALAGLAATHAGRSASAPGAALAGPFGFGGRVQGSEPSGLAARLGVLDFSDPGA
jgi:hypothetical protein